MSEAAKPFPIIREAVASFPDREHVRHAVSALLAGGFARDDLSVLASHDSLAVAEEAAGTPKEVVRAGLTDEIKYIAPLTVAGIIVLSGGPIALTIAALVGAGLGGAALKEFFDDYTAARHSEDFAAALTAGAALLWVRCPDPDSELAATRILEQPAAATCTSTAAPNDPGSAPADPAECSPGLASVVRKPIPEDLIDGVLALFEPRPNTVRGLAMLIEIGCCELGRGAALFLNHGIELMPKTRTLFQHILDLRSRVEDCRSPSPSRTSGEGGF